MQISSLPQLVLVYGETDNNLPGCLGDSDITCYMKIPSLIQCVGYIFTTGMCNPSLGMVKAQRVNEAAQA
jgi:hypothetical protein